MPRNLSSAIQNAIAQNRSSVCHLLSFAVGQASYWFAEDQVRFQGNLYQPWLSLDSPVKYTQKLQLDRVTVKLQNLSLDTAAILKATGSDMQGAEARLQRLYLNANDAVTLFVGRIADIDVDEQSATITLAGDLDPTASQVPTRKYSATCVWVFKDQECGYTDGVDPLDPATSAPFATCPKDFLSCGARGRQHRFPGFIHISRDLTLAVEGQAPDASSDSRMLAELIRPWEEI
jgi:phage-related protein